MESLYEWIRNLVVYMILNTIIMNLLGNSSYKKYVSIASGMLLVLLVVSPIMSLLKLDEQLDYFFETNSFAVEASDFKNSLQTMEQRQSEAIFSDYKERIKKKIEDMLSEEAVYVKKFNVAFQTDVESKNFGQILWMSLELSQQKEDTLKQVDQVRSIDISKIIIEEKREEVQDKVPSPTEIKLKNKLSDFYNIEPANINISIQGG